MYKFPTAAQPLALAGSVENSKACATASPGLAVISTTSYRLRNSAAIAKSCEEVHKRRSSSSRSSSRSHRCSRSCSISSPSRSSRPTVRVCMSCAAHGVFFISFGSISSHGEGNSVESKGAAYKHFVPLFTVAILAQGTISG